MSRMKEHYLEHVCSICDRSYEEMLDLLAHLKEIHGK